MMKNNLVMKLSILLIAVLGTTNAISQEITGQIVDSELKPIAGATITMHTEDSTFVDATISKDDGSFRFSANTIPFILTIQHIAYEAIVQIFQDYSVGVIQMQIKPNEIDEVVVSAKKPYVKVEDGKLIYKTEAIINDEITNNAWDLLNKLPGISSNGSKVSLLGANKVTVILDGKVSTLSQDELYTILNNTPVARIEKAEIIYNAPPHYHTNGAIVNLVMHQPKNLGVDGEISMNYTNQYYSSGNMNANFRVTSSKTTFDVMYGIDRNAKMQYSEIESHHLLHNTLHDIYQTERISSKSWKHNIKASLDYRISNNNNVSINYVAMLTPNNTKCSNTIGSLQNSNNNKKEKTNFHNISLSSKLNCGLSIGCDYTHYSSSNNQKLYVDYLNNTHSNIISRSSQTIDKYYVYADQYHSLGDEWNIGYGISYMYLYDRDDQFYDIAETHNQIHNTDSKLKEHRADMYISVAKQFKMGLHFNASLKGEYYKIGNYKNLSIYPQFSINYSKSSKHIYQLGLSSDKIYPKYWTMASSISYIDGYSEIHGTPEIRPATNYNMNASYIFDRKYIISGFYSYTNNYFAQSPYQSTEKLVLIYKTANWNYMQNIGINVLVPINIGKWWRCRITGVGMYVLQRCDDFFDISFNRKRFVFMGNIDNTFHIKNNLLFELSGNLQTPSIQGTFDVGTIASINAGIKWSFAKGKMSLSLYCNDILNTSSPKLSVDFKGQDFTMDNRFYSRMLYVKFNYKFGGFTNNKEQKIDMSRLGH